MPGPLAGLRVIDCSHGTAGPRATGILADYGADVVWVEPIGGDPARDELAVSYSVFNRGKRSIELDLDSQHEELLELLHGAHLFVESWRPGSAAKRRLDFASLHASFPSLVCCSISGFGQAGPHVDLPGYESLVHAVLGTTSVQVGFREAPIYEGLPFASVGAAALAVIGSLAALYRCHLDGVGRYVETSLLDGALAYLGISQADEATGEGAIIPGSKRLVARTFLCADDEYIGVHTGSVGGFGRFLQVVGLADRIEATASGRDLSMFLNDKERQIIAEELPTIFATRPRDDWLTLLLDADIAVNPVLRAGEVFDEPQPRHNGAVLRLDDPKLGVVDMVAPAIRFGLTTVRVGQSAPRVGQHTREVLGQLGSRPTKVAHPATGAEPQNVPVLDGVHVLDLGAFHAGPYSSRLLADLGAEVVKLEPLHGDPCRGMIRPFRSAQAKKRSIAMDLKNPSARGVTRDLLGWADVVHHNMRPGAAERLGIGYEQVREVNPEVIYTYAPGWGSDGPWSNRQSFEPLMSDYVGASFEVAGQFNPPLFPCGHADPGAGLMSAAGMLMGLLHRQRTGRGQLIESTQLSAAMLHVAHIVRGADGTVHGDLRLDPLQMGVHALDRLYQTKDGWVSIVAQNEHHLQGLGDVLGVDLLADDRFATRESRAANDYDLTDFIATAFAEITEGDLVARLATAGVLVAIPRPDKLSAFYDEPEHERIGRVCTLPNTRFGRVREIDALVRIAGMDRVVHTIAPELGDHTEAILREHGRGQSDIDELRAQGAIA